MDTDGNNVPNKELKNSLLDSWAYTIESTAEGSYKAHITTCSCCVQVSPNSSLENITNIANINNVF